MVRPVAARGSFAHPGRLRADPRRFTRRVHARRKPAIRPAFLEDRLEPTLGFEPRTCCLRNSCSTAELCRRAGEYRCCLAERAMTRLVLPPTATVPSQGERADFGSGKACMEP